MRDVIFLVADGSMEQMLRGFFGRQAFHRSLGCGRFDVDPARDIIVAPNRDSGGPGQAYELLRLYTATHERAVVILDNAWGGSPGPSRIKDQISRRLRTVWSQFTVIVIEPELEAWFWQDSSHVATALGGPANFRSILARSGHWPAGQVKPCDPKAALEHLRSRHSADQSKAVFKRVASRISVKGCVDPAFQQLRDTLRDWFPEESL